MFRTLAILCLVAASAFGSWEGGLSVSFNLTLLGSETTAFITLPRTSASATEKGWNQTTLPSLPEVYASLSIFCPVKDHTICAFYDDTGFIAGLQVAFNKDNFSDNIFDWDVQGYTSWTVDVNGTIQNFWTTQQYYISPETLATDSATRVAQRNPDLLLQDESILVSGFNGELYRISTNVSDITGSNSNFTEQACIPRMGIHYCYNTTEDLECKADTVFPWFPLIHSEQLIGVGLMAFGNYTVNDGEKDWFERPASTTVQTIVPTGPQCLYDLADSPGVITMHIYFIETPYLVTCVF